MVQDFYKRLEAGRELDTQAWKDTQDDYDTCLMDLTPERPRVVLWKDTI